MAIKTPTQHINKMSSSSSANRANRREKVSLGQNLSVEGSITAASVHVNRERLEQATSTPAVVGDLSGAVSGSSADAEILMANFLPITAATYTVTYNNPHIKLGSAIIVSVLNDSTTTVSAAAPTAGSVVLSVVQTVDSPNVRPLLRVQIM